MVEMKSKRLTIRDHIEADLPSVIKLLSDKAVMFYLKDLAVNNIEEAKANLDVCISESQSKNRKKFFFAIIENESQNYVGQVGFGILSYSQDGPLVDLGYFLFSEYWGKGYATEATLKTIEFAFNSVNARKIRMGC